MRALAGRLPQARGCNVPEASDGTELLIRPETVRPLRVRGEIDPQPPPRARRAPGLSFATLSGFSAALQAGWLGPSRQIAGQIEYLERVAFERQLFQMPGMAQSIGLAGFHVLGLPSVDLRAVASRYNQLIESDYDRTKLTIFAKKLD